MHWNWKALTECIKYSDAMPLLKCLAYGQYMVKYASRLIISLEYDHGDGIVKIQYI